MRVGEELHHEILNSRWAYWATASDEENYSGAKKNLDALGADLRRIMNNLSPKDLEAKDHLWTYKKRLDDARDEMLHHGRECTATFDCPATITNETIMESLRDESHLTLLYRIALEAIINARKHSKGTSIGVKIRAPKPGVVEISIHDDGIGDGGPFAENVGFALMSQRAEEIGAELAYTAAYPRGGTVVLIRLNPQAVTDAPTAAQVIAAIKSHAQPTPKRGADHATGSER